MTIAPPPTGRPKPNGSPVTPSKPKNRLGSIDPSVVPPDRIVLYAIEGWGKTSLASFAPNPAILMARGETGYPTLRKYNLVPDVPAAEISTWEDLMDQLDFIISNPVEYKTLALDALGGFERLCHEMVCARDYKGVWGDKGFDSYKEGYDVSVADWLLMLQKLDRIRAKGIQPIILAHAKVSPFKNPDGPDFDRYSAECHHKTWSVTAKWADNVFFGRYESLVIDSKGAVADTSTKGRKKGIGGTERVLFTQRRDSFDAKNRCGMAEEITIPNTPSEMWPTLVASMSKPPINTQDDAPPM
jgi:hypothetical protein